MKSEPIHYEMIEFGQIQIGKKLILLETESKTFFAEIDIHFHEPFDIRIKNVFVDQPFCLFMENRCKETMNIAFVDDRHFVVLSPKFMEKCLNALKPFIIPIPDAIRSCSRR